VIYTKKQYKKGKNLHHSQEDCQAGQPSRNSYTNISAARAKAANSCGSKNQCS